MQFAPKSAAASLAMLLVAVLLPLLLLSATPLEAAIIYQTGFEASEGYSTNKNLAGQNGWLAVGTGGNGIVPGFIPGSGQQAYVGFAPPLTNESSLFVYHPINQNVPQVQFSVTMSIIDSTTTNRDDFYWSVFNQQGDQLFTLDFDNEELRLYYYLDDNKARTWSGLTFTNNGSYQLVITMDFIGNRWSAIFNGAVVAAYKPITTVSAPLNLGDIDAAWAIWDPNAPGDNFMVFDNYKISSTVQPQLQVLGMTNGVPTIQVAAPDNTRFAVEASTNLMSWLPLKTNVTSGGSFVYVDNSALGVPSRFYRARLVP